jgi:predicted esterase
VNKNKDIYRRGRLTSRQVPGNNADATGTGVLPLHANNGKDSLIYVPGDYHPGRPAPLAVMLHGAGGVAEHGLSYLRHLADAYQIILVAPASKSYSWDLIAEEKFNADILLIDKLLDHVFAHYAIDSSSVAIGGFSDGASYALSVGLGNGDLFTHVLAFSPGFYFTMERNGNPGVFISHGTNDDVLPIDYCSRRIVLRLQREKAPVIYNEFEGRHEIPEAISRTAVEWFLPA